MFRRLFDRLRGVPAMSADAQWCAAQLANDEMGVSAEVEFIDARPLGTEGLTWAVQISWRFADSGEPDAEHRPTIDAIDAGMTAFKRNPGRSQVAWIRRGFGVAEWLFYADDGDAFVHELAEAIALETSQPLAFSFSRDARWKQWSEIVTPIRKRAVWEAPRVIR
jgi:hypothetical protein